MKFNFKKTSKNILSFWNRARVFLLLWGTQALSALGSSMTSFALIIWAYRQQDSAMTTAMLSVCSYAPYVLTSLFAGALSDRWNKKTVMLICDSLAALSTVAVLILLETGRLELWHLYALNALNGLMNTVQQPAADVAVTLLTPQQDYQRASSLRSLSGSLCSILTPGLAAALLALAGMRAVILVDLLTFAVAFVTLLGFIRIPEAKPENKEKEPAFQTARDGLRYLREHRGILHLILFLAAVNLTASMYNAALPAMVLPRRGGGETALGVLGTVTGLSMLAGSVVSSLLPAPKSRVRVICNTLLISLGADNLLLAVGRSLPVWCVGGVLGWGVIPLMNANMDVLLRTEIPVEMQGRVYSARNSLQFFTIPVGYFLGGWLVDSVLEPWMAAQAAQSLPVWLFGQGKGSGAAALFLLNAALGVLTCLLFRKDRHISGRWKTFLNKENTAPARKSRGHAASGKNRPEKLPTYPSRIFQTLFMPRSRLCQKWVLE